MQCKLAVLRIISVHWGKVIAKKGIIVWNHLYVVTTIAEESFIQGLAAALKELEDRRNVIVSQRNKQVNKIIYF